MKFNGRSCGYIKATLIELYPMVNGRPRRLAGPVIEALLLCAISQTKADTAAAVTQLLYRKINLPREERVPEDWSLHKYIEVSAELKIISGKTAAQGRLAKGFRNLIRPRNNYPTRNDRGYRKL